MKTRKKTISNDLPRDLGDGLILRQATPADTEALVAFNAQTHREHGIVEPDERVAAWVRDLMAGHPTFHPEDFTLVEDTRTGNIVSSLNLISQTWAYEGIPFKVGRVELVGTHPDYRNRGLIRTQFEVVHQWSAARSEMVQGITGIPYYYRQFGYEMAMTLGGMRVGYKPHIPKLKEGESEPYRVRPATEADLPFIAELYGCGAERQPVHCLRDETQWRYELNGRRAQNVNGRLLCVIENTAGEPVGFITHASRLGGTQISLSIYELKPGLSWLAVTPGIIRYLWATGGEYAVRDQKECEAFAFNLGVEHPAYAVAADRLPVVRDPYAWYIRVADVPGFVRHIAPVLERRLAASTAAGYSGELKISFYRSGMLLKLEQGRLADVTDWQPSPEDWGNALFPGLTFLHLLFGHRTFDELRHTFADCGVVWQSSVPSDEICTVLNALFPKRPSHVWAID